MARCCAEGKCYCVVTAGDNITVEGNGTASNPYVITGEEGGGGGGGDIPVSFTFVRYDAVDGWPVRPTVPTGWAVMWINEVDNTPPSTGGSGAISGLDIALLALPL